MGDFFFLGTEKGRLAGWVNVEANSVEESNRENHLRVCHARSYARKDVLHSW